MIHSLVNWINNTMRKILLICSLLICILTLALTGCSATSGTISIAATDLINQTIENRIDVSSIIAGGEMKIVDKPSKFSLSTKIEMIAEDPYNLRIKATKLADEIVAFDMLMQGERVAFYVPLRNVLYTGDVSNLSSGGVNFSPKAIINRILHANRDLLNKRWRVLGRNSAGLMNENLVLEELHKNGAPFVKIYVDGMRRVLHKVEHFNKAGKLYFIEEYSKFEQEMTGDTTFAGREIGSGRYFPMQFVLDWPDKKRSVKITLRRYRSNVSQDELDELWVIDDLDMDSVQQRSLAQVDVEGDEAYK